MNIKYIAIGIFPLIMLSCSAGAPDANEAELRVATAAGRDAAEKALEFPEGTMEREGAIIRIRARETAIRDAGFPSCADSFAVAAERVLAPVIGKR